MFVIQASSKFDLPPLFWERGFTLVELLVTMTLVAILSAIALPSLSSFVTNSRVSSRANDFVAAINLARSEAVKRSSGVTICPSSNAATCATAADWASGWIVFSDHDIDATADTGDELIHVFPGLSGGITMVLGNNGTITKSITFLGVGRSVASFGGTVATLCPPEGGDYCRYICINSLGRPRVDTPAQKIADKNCGN